MFKYLAIIAVSLFVFPIQAYSQTQNTQEKPKHTTSSPQASDVAAQNEASHSSQDKTDTHVNADVRIISTPEKDSYDRIAFLISIALAIVGFLGIGIGVCTLRYIKAQVIEMRRQVTASHDALRAWIGIDVHENNLPAITMNMINQSTGSLTVAPQRFEWEITNFGQTPAFIKSVCVSNRAYPMGSAGGWQQFSKPISPNSFLGSGKSEKHVLTLSDEALKQCELRHMIWRFVVKIEYRDAFNREHETMASFHYYIPTGASDPLRKDFYQDSDSVINYNT